MEKRDDALEFTVRVGSSEVLVKVPPVGPVPAPIRLLAYWPRFHAGVEGLNGAELGQWMRGRDGVVHSVHSMIGGPHRKWEVLHGRVEAPGLKERR